MSSKVALFYICEKRFWYQVTDIFKAKAQVEYTGWKIDIQQTVSERLAARAVRTKNNPT